MASIADAEAELGFPLMEVKEGSVTVLAPRINGLYKGYSPSRAPVFYNPMMELNRDFAVVLLQSLREDLSREIDVCEPLTGCGIRGVRFAVEVEGLRRVVVNDINPKAARLTTVNVKKANVDRIVDVQDSDANIFLSQFSKPKCRMDYVDIDPFGSPGPYVESSLRALRDGGVLALTATDMPLLCGVHVKACVRRYGIKPLRTEYCHELAVRILVGYSAVAAAKRGFSVKPLFCHSTDHYVRVYLRVERGVAKADLCLEKLGYVLHCFTCLDRRLTLGLFPTFKMVCEGCGNPVDFAGPVWLGKLWDSEIVQRISSLLETKSLGQKNRMRRIMGRIRGEMDANPAYYVLSHFCDFFDYPVPAFSEVLRGIRVQGYDVSLTHFNPNGIKTEMPAKVLKEILSEISSAASKKALT